MIYVNRKRNTTLESHLLQIVVPFLIQYIFQKWLKAKTEKYAFLTKKNLDFFVIFIVSNLVCIYSRDSTYNFRLLHLILDYIMDNL